MLYRVQTITHALELFDGYLPVKLMSQRQQLTHQNPVIHSIDDLKARLDKDVLLILIAKFLNMH